MNKRLIILSDLWGREKSDWLINYTEVLKAHFDITYYDCCELGGINKSDYNEKSLHQQFVNGGIERAVQKLTALEQHTISILAFSIGGTIAWKFGINNTKIDTLTCISSTRLRHETIQSKAKIKLFYGENDIYRPQEEWLNNMRLDYEIIGNKDHLLYRDIEFAQRVSQEIIEST